MRELMILILLGAAGYFGYDAWNKGKEIDDLSNQIAALERDKEKLEKDLKGGSGNSGSPSRPGATTTAGAVEEGPRTASIDQAPRVRTITVRCYFCEGNGSYQYEMGGRPRQTPCNICQSNGRRVLRIPTTGWVVCGGKDDETSGSQVTCKGMGRVARLSSLSGGNNRGSTFVESPDGHQRYSAIACPRCKSKGVVAKVAGEDI